MAVPIYNAKNRPLNQSVGTLPQMAGALDGWLQPMTFTRIVKETINAVVVETAEDVDFLGVWQPFSARALSMKPEGERKWKWFTLHAKIGFILTPDEVVKYQGTQFRVRDEINYKEYGYVEYHIVEDYSGSGPYASTP